MGDTFSTALIVGLLTRAHIVWAAYSFLCKSLKIKYVVQRRLEFLKAVRFERYVIDDFVCWATCEGLHSLGSILISREILENRICDPASVGILKAVRFGRYVFNELVRWASYEGPHSLGLIFISR